MYVNGKSTSNQNSIYLLAKALDVKEGWLMGFDEPKSSPDPNWKSEITVKDEKSIERELEVLLEEMSEQGGFATYDPKRLDEMTEEEFENHILFKNALRETLRIAKKINKEKHTPHKYRKRQ